ncbi:MAG: neutral zinc metallopeptidase [Polyangiales bacterium]
MEIDRQRRSENFEDRGRGRGGGGGGGVPIRALVGIARLLGVRGTLALVVVCVVGYFLMPDALRQALFGGGGSSTGSPGSGSVCAANAAACDFSRAVLGSTEDVWRARFAEGRLPAGARGAYREPTLVVFTDRVTTEGCGEATSAVGPFYCSADERLYIDPTFYDVMARELRSPGDFAQAYVIAHEVGHHVQKLIGSSRRSLPGESRNQTSVRIELQADCFAGVWGSSARSALSISDEDLREALRAAHAIGDDALGHRDADEFTHGTSDQRMRWFRRGFDGGDATACDTFAVGQFGAL